jgi:hypothetical protein
MHRYRQGWRRLVFRTAWLAAKLRACLRVLLQRCRPPSEQHRGDGRAAFLRGKVQAEDRFHAAQAEERRLGGLTPLPTGQPSAGEQPQARQQTAHDLPPPGRRR